VTGRFEDRVCLVTGATGIAEATAMRLADEGARVFIATRTAAHGEALAARVREAGRPAATIAVDLAADGSADAAVDACLGAFGRVDAVFNVAGGSGRRFGDGPVHEVDGAGWDATLDLNARSTFLMCGAAVRAMLAQQPASDGSRGAILNMSSILARHPSAGHFATHAYAASKGSIEAFSRAMAARYATDRIRVNSIAPALTLTPMAGRAASDPATQAYAAWKQPLAGGFIDPGDVAAAAAFLLSGDAAQITGQVLTVDGGWSVVDEPAPSATAARA
jgi:NAD(P)-dependent dehydrogenase (short-subunit alcohol dehydrogenase family)